MIQTRMKLKQLCVACQFRIEKEIYMVLFIVQRGQYEKIFCSMRLPKKVKLGKGKDSTPWFPPRMVIPLPSVATSQRPFAL